METPARLLGGTAGAKANKEITFSIASSSCPQTLPRKSATFARPLGPGELARLAELIRLAPCLRVGGRP